MHGQHLPRASADRQRVAIAHAAKPRGHRGHDLPVVMAGLDPGLVQPVRPVVVESPGPAIPSPPGELGHEPLRLRAPELDAALLGEPVRVAHVVGVKVRHEDASDRTTAEVRREEALPQGACVVETHAGVHDGPAVAVLEEPEIDVVELEWQRHAQPADAGRDGHDVGGRRRSGPRMVERHAVQCTLRWPVEPDVLGASKEAL
jgi:hypothetical protein